MNAFRLNRAELLDAAMALVLSLVALVAFRSSYGGVEFLVVGVVGALLGVLVAHLGTRWRWPIPVIAVVALIVYAVIGGAVTLRDRTIAGFLPSPSSIATAFREAVVGWKELITTSPPVGRTGDLMALPFVGAFTAATVSYLLARRLGRALPPVLPAAALLGLGIACGLDEPVSFVLHGAVFAVLSLAWMAWREHRRRPVLEGIRIQRRQMVAGLALLVVASVIGVGAAPALPFTDRPDRAIWRQTVTPPFDPRQYPSPLSGYRSYVKKPGPSGGSIANETPMFTIEGLPEGMPVRLATMDAYDGLVWQVTGGDPEQPSLNDSGSFERVGAELPPEFPGTEAEVTITIGKYSDVWVPDVGEVISMRFTGSAGGKERDRQLAEAFRYNRATDTGASRLRLQEGDRYVMKVRLPVVLDTLAGQTVVPQVERLGQTQSVTQLAEKLQTEVLAIKDTGAQLDTITRLMRAGTYSDGDDMSGNQGSRAGHSVYRLREFVGDYPKLPFIGNAEQYASAFALLFRDLGRLPTRVVMGFKPSKQSTDDAVEVLAREIEAWVEVPVEGKGWVAVFPTPERDQLALTSASNQQPEPDYRTQNPPEPPVIDPEFEFPATASGKAKATKKNEPPKPKDAEDSLIPELPAPVRIGFIAASPFLVLLLVALVIVVLKRRRRDRRRRRGLPHVRVANGWREVTDLALDMGKPVPSNSTRREAAAFVGGGTTSLASRADAVVWNRGEPTDQEVEEYWAECVAALTSMRSELGIVDRLKAAVSLRSLRRAKTDSPKGHR